MTRMRIDEIMKRSLLYFCFLLVSFGIRAQGVFEAGEEPRTVRTNGFWQDWFVQAGLDMTLQNPYGYDFSKVFPNGKTFGLDVAAGKWFSHQVGYRVKFNWENRLPLLKNDHANWLAPFDQPGVNRDKGGYIALYADALMNLHNLFGAYRADRTWNASLYPRIGVNYNFGVSKGALLAGVGVLNTYRLSDRWSLYGDIAYIMTGSGFVGSEKVEGTGTGSNSNGYLTIGIGAQVALGKTHSPVQTAQQGQSPLCEITNALVQTTPTPPNSGGEDLAENEKSYAPVQTTPTPPNLGGESAGVLTNGIWDNWFVQVGLDMSLMNPYGCNFSKVIPKGMTFGLNGALGKWFTPEFALRARVQWENGLIPNNGVEWLPPADDPKQNYKKGGLATIAFDAMLNLTNVAAGYNPERKWHTTGYVRAGIITQFVVGSASPLAGAGLEETYRLNDRLSLFGALGYQVSTSEGLGYGMTGMDVAAGSNGFFDIDFGIRYDLGRNRFYRDEETKRAAYSQPVAGHNWPRFAVNTLASVGVGFALKTALKKMVKEERPDHSDKESFPSGHATMAFAAARSIDKEFRKESIWIPIAGYAAATAIGVERVASDRHHWYDVVAGAGLGIASAELTWWLSDMLFPQRKYNVAIGTSGNTIDVSVAL